MSWHGFWLILLIYLSGCSSHDPKSEEYLFESLGPDETGIQFRNELSYSEKFNLFKYIYFYNGSGVGVADFNGDGRSDIFFGSNQGQNRLYLNEGEFRFKDVTKAAQVPADGGWTTGISVVDINNDGWMDIYVCRVGQYETLDSRNLLLINEGIGADSIPRFREAAAEYGLDFKGFSTQAAFFDYDLDGDLDMFLLNHSVHENGTFRPRNEFLNTRHPLSGDRLYRNDNGRYSDATEESGIQGSAIGYGLGIAVSDINGDGWPDIYIGNDFHENDYLYINQGNGRFREMATELLQHSSQFSMGVDVADVNNDARPEIISVDMLPEDAVILKRSLGEDAYDIFQHKISVGYSHQYTRNNLQWNRPEGKFSELGLYSGIAATDWSWSPLWMDFDNDGYKDLFISNGIPKRMNDIDYVNFVSNTEVRKSIANNAMKDKDMELIKKFPEIRLANKFFQNKGDFQFEDKGSAVKGEMPGFSNGAAYADFDNDGFLDIVVNNIDAPATLYRNLRKDTTKAAVLQLWLQGPEANRQAIGARVWVFEGNEKRLYEKFPARGFLSSSDAPMQIGLGDVSRIDSILLVWPDNTKEKIQVPASENYKQVLKKTYQKGLQRWQALPEGAAQDDGVAWEEITAAAGIDFVHRENHFVEFDREPLIPHMLSTEGPALAVADINGDGWEDVFFGGARNQVAQLYLQDGRGGFLHKSSPALLQDSMYEDVDAIWMDMNADGHPDLVVASGGNEFYGKDPHNEPRLYLNDGQGNLQRKRDAFSGLFLTASCLAITDINGDKAPDIFIGARTVPWEYGQMPESYLLQNDGQGKFSIVTDKWNPELASAGMVTDAKWVDLDQDGDEDLLLALEWGAITAWMREGNRLMPKALGPEKGWWNFVEPFDIDGDGDLDIVAGNMGLNGRLKPTSKEPVRLYFNDFDDNGKHEQVMTYYLRGRELPFANKAELEKQIPILRKKYLYAEDFANASLPDLLGSEKLKGARIWEADFAANAILVNDGKGNFTTKALNWQQQLAPLRAGLGLGTKSGKGAGMMLMGNYYDNNIQMGRYDADFGSWLKMDSKAELSWRSIEGWMAQGQVRQLAHVRMPAGPAVVVARNNGPASLIILKP
jgi:hypothetical protein